MPANLLQDSEYLSASIQVISSISGVQTLTITQDGAGPNGSNRLVTASSGSGVGANMINARETVTAGAFVQPGMTVFGAFYADLTTASAGNTGCFMYTNATTQVGTYNTNTVTATNAGWTVCGPLLVPPGQFQVILEYWNNASTTWSGGPIWFSEPMVIFGIPLTASNAGSLYTPSARQTYGGWSASVLAAEQWTTGTL